METRCLKTNSSWRNGLIIHTLSKVFKIKSPDKNLKKKKIASVTQKPATKVAKPIITPTLNTSVSMAPMAPSEDKQRCNGKPAATSASSTTSSVPNPAAAKRTPNDFIFGKVIGEGSFSTVYVAKDIHTHKQYAIKVCEKQHIIREKKTEHMKREKEALNILSSAGVPFFVKLYCTFQDSERLYFVLSYAKFGELLPYINKVGSFDVECTRFYAGEILVALEHLKRLKIIHRDLKPENVLLDENMHILIADFGSAKLNFSTNTARTTCSSVNKEDKDSEDEKARRNSFVGTAQYVSPELLTDKSATHSSDLWALGCIIYQMIAGLPPFRSRSEYIIFQKILKLEYEFPQGFCPRARDLVENLLVIEPTGRLGATDTSKYVSIRAHPFFNGVDFDNLHQTAPPPIYPYLPGASEDEDLRSNYKVPDSLEPGLNDKQLTRLLGLDLQPTKSIRKKSSILDINEEEMKTRLAFQRSSSIWHPFVEGNLILKEGLVDKRKGLFAKRRMLLLTTGPHLYYVDPVNMVLKGEIPWTSQLRVEPKNFKIFFVHTPNRTYYLEDPQGYALEWCKVIEEVRVNSSNPST